MNKNNEFEFLFNNKNKPKLTRNKLNKVQCKKSGCSCHTCSLENF